MSKKDLKLVQEAIDVLSGSKKKNPSFEPPPPIMRTKKVKGSDSSMSDTHPLVFILGNGMVKCGFSGDSAPRAVFPTIIGKAKNPGIMVGMDSKDYFVGDEAQAKRGILNIFEVLDKGDILNWEHVEKVLHHTLYNECRVAPEEHPILFGVHPFMSNEDREKLADIAFDKFQIPAIYVGSNPLYGIYASGRTTGLVCNVGYSSSTCLAVNDGAMVKPSKLLLPIGGKAITNYLVKILNERGLEMTTKAEREIVRDIKEKLGYVALDYDSEIQRVGEGSIREVEYELPDGSKVSLGSERFRAPEILFKPSFVECELPGIDEMIYNSLSKCEVDIRKDMYQNILLMGGSTLFEGIVERISEDVQKISPKHSRIKVNAPGERKYSSWIGGSILASLNTFSGIWVTKEVFEDSGPSVIHRQCY